MAESERGFSLPQYGVLESRRLQSKKVYELINLVSARFGKGISWSRASLNCIDLGAGKSCLWFKFHGNKFAKSVEFLCSDVAVLHQVRAAFPAEFERDVEVREGVC